MTFANHPTVTIIADVAGSSFQTTHVPVRRGLTRRRRSAFLFVGLALVFLAGVASAQTVSLSATTLSFGNEVVGTTSAVKKVTLTNTGSATLSISSIVVSGSFTESNTCASSVAAGKTCTIAVMFAPPIVGAATGAVTITDSATNSPQTISTTGTGIVAAALSPATLTFASRTLGTTSNPSVATLTNNLSTVLTITSVAVTGDFAQTNTCGTSVAAKGKCTISVTFTPTAVGTRTGTLSVTDNGGNSPQTTSLTGTGSTSGLTSIAITPANPSSTVGATEQFQATGTFTGGNTFNLTSSVTWGSSKTTVATISNVAGTQGLATVLAAGTATIKAISGSISGSTVLTATSPTLVSITVTPAASSIVLGTQQQFTATGNYSDGSTKNLTSSATWKSTATNVATISSAGLASAVASGTTTISATSGAVTGSTTLTVNPAALLSIAVTPANSSAALGTTQQFKAVGTYSDGSTLDLTTTASWTSSATGVASISNAAGTQGLASTLATGTSNINASLGSVSGVTAFTVTPAALTSIVVTPALLSISLGAIQQFTATGKFTDGTTQDVTSTAVWSSSAPSIATISNATGTQGVATSVATGVTTITAASGTVNGSTSVTVTPAALISIAVTPANETIATGTTQQFTAIGTFSDNSTQNLTSSVTWSSSNLSLATISNAGLATGASVGGVTISAASGTVSGSTTLTVSEATLISIAVTPATASIPDNTTQQFTATGTFSDSSTQNITGTVNWSSSDGTVATISDSPGSQGLATGVDAGSITITATSGAVNGSANLTVTAVTLVSISITPANSSIALGDSEQFSATGTYSDGSTSDITELVTWGTTSSSIAVISNATGSQGLATSAGLGNTSVGAKLGQQTATTTLTVGSAALISILVTPATSSIALGATQPFTATGTFSDGSTQSLTDSVTWTSSNPAVAAISNQAGTQGVATGAGLGTTAVTATSGSVTGSASLTVITMTLVSISVSPQSPAIFLGMNEQFTATGTYSDGSTQNITSSVVWSSAAPAVATISNLAGSQGLATSAGLGIATIIATLGSTASTNLTVTASATLPTWTQDGPLARFAHTTVFDPVTQGMIIFGGERTDGQLLNDVWLATTSLTGARQLTYTQMFPGGIAPSARFGHVATYDQNTNRMTMFGGTESSDGPCLNDVWTLDGANGQSGESTWLALTPSGTAPSARVHHTGVYDPGTNSLIVFGGSNCNSGFLNDVWVLNNANGEGGTPTWTQLSPSGPLPPARESSSAIYDATNHVMTIYGGDAGGSALGDVWVLSNANGHEGTPVWTQLSPTGTAPQDRTAHSAVYDSVNNRMIVFGGFFETFTLGDSWILTFANGLGGTPAWVALTAQGTGAEPTVGFHTAVYNQALNTMYIFAGTSTTEKLQTSNHLFTLTTANGLPSGSSQWILAGPPVRYSASAFYDPATNSLFTYGGQHSAVTLDFADYNRAENVIGSSNLTWVEVTTNVTGNGAHPPGRFGHTGLYDSASNRMMIFGGGLGFPAPCANDYWVLKNANGIPGTGVWTPITPSGTAPGARMRQSAVFDPTTNSMIVFGGYNCQSTYFNDLWILSDANNTGATPVWTQVTPLGSVPNARESASAVYDPVTNTMVIFGGDAGGTTFGDLWMLSNANGTGGTPTWTQVTTSGGGPSARTGHSAIYNSQNNLMTVYGGLNSGAIFGDTWVLANANGHGSTAPSWTQIIPIEPGPARAYHSTVYDPVSNQMLIFAGKAVLNPLQPDNNVFSLTDANGLP